MEYETSLFREDGTAAPRLPIGNRIYGLGGSTWKKTLAPGEEVKGTLELSKIFDLKGKGKYYVRAWRPVSTERAGSPRGAATSDIATFVISE